MKIKPYLPQPGQVICHDFDLKTRIKSVAIKDNEIYIPAPKSDMPFDPLECFVFYRNPPAIVGIDSLFTFETSFLSAGRCSVKTTGRLLQYLPNVWLESIHMTFTASKFKPEDVPDHLELKLISVFHLMEPPFVAQVKDKRLYTWADGDDVEDSLKQPKEYLPPPPLSKPVIEKRGGRHLTVVPTHKDKSAKPDRRKKQKAPKDVLKYFKHLAPKSKWRLTFKAMYNQSKYYDITDNKYFQGTYPKKGRWYTFGVDRLEDVTGQGDRTVKRHLSLMREHKLIRRIKGGFPGQGNSIYEVPLDLSHIMAWRKHPKPRQKRKW